jgi:hypothetical protein
MERMVACGVTPAMLELQYRMSPAICELVSARAFAPRPGLGGPGGQINGECFAKVELILHYSDAEWAATGRP